MPEIVSDASEHGSDCTQCTAALWWRVERRHCWVLLAAVHLILRIMFQSSGALKSLEPANYCCAHQLKIMSQLSSDVYHVTDRAGVTVHCAGIRFATEAAQAERVRTTGEQGLLTRPVSH